jgi:hypothetical protein
MGEGSGETSILASTGAGKEAGSGVAAGAGVGDSGIIGAIDATTGWAFGTDLPSVSMQTLRSVSALPLPRKLTDSFSSGLSMASVLPRRTESENP